MSRDRMVLKVFGQDFRHLWWPAKFKLRCRSADHPYGVPVTSFGGQKYKRLDVPIWVL